MNSFSILESVVSDLAIEEYNDDSIVSTLLSITILTRFMLNYNEQVTPYHVWELFSKIKNNSLNFSDDKINKSYELRISKMVNINFKLFEKIVEKLSLFVNENLEIQQIIQRWQSGTYKATLAIGTITSTIRIKILSNSHTPYSVNYIITNKKYTAHALTIGKKDLRYDYGYAKQLTFLRKMFLIDINSAQTLDNYKKIVKNSDIITSETIFEASRYLFNEYSTILNKMLFIDNDIKENIYNVFNSTIVKGQQCSESKIIKYDDSFNCSELDHSKIYFMLKHDDIKIQVPEGKNPMINILSNDMPLLRIRMKKELYGKSLTGNRYKLYIEPIIKQ